MKLYKVGIVFQRVYDDGAVDDRATGHAAIPIRADSLLAAIREVKEKSRECCPLNFVKLHDHYWTVGMIGGRECIEKRVKTDGDPCAWWGDSSIPYRYVCGMKDERIPIEQIERDYKEGTRVECVEIKVEELLKSDSISPFPAEKLEYAFPSCLRMYNPPVDKKITEGGLRLSSRKAGGCEIESVEVYFPKQLNTHLGWPDESHLFEMIHLEKFRRWVLFAGKRWSDRDDEDCPHGCRAYGPFEVPREGARRIAEAYGYRGSIDDILSRSPDELRSQGASRCL